MARENNFLLGNGEKLSHSISIKRNSGEKKPPYEFAKAKTRIQERLVQISSALDTMAQECLPNDETVALVTMHPRYISKSDFPVDLFSAVGLRTVGNRQKRVKPESWGIQKPPEDAITEEIFVAGTRKAFRTWTTGIASWTPVTKGAEDLSHIEDIALLLPDEKLKGIPDSKEKVLFEIVLHNGCNPKVFQAFVDFAKRHHAEPLVEKRRDVGGLSFIPVFLKTAFARELASFSFVRVARGMPSLRPFRPNVARGHNGFFVNIPKDHCIDSSFRAVIFDGGIPATAHRALQPWVNLIDPPGIGPAEANLEAHGLAVTTAFLFGPIQENVQPPAPICNVDHVRVLDSRNAAGKSFEYTDVLDHIVNYLKANPRKYKYCNISLGPDLAVDDDEITAWTAALDAEFAHGTSVVTVAAGNSGERDGQLGLNRVQPPADGVNLLAVGAADSLKDGWRKAKYSSVGPGRCPGLIKPDGVAFGGSDKEPFGVLLPSLRGDGVQGTSFSAPFTLRTAASVQAQLGTSLQPLAIRALLIHRAEPNGLDQADIGWGRFENRPLQLITCNDDEALIVYQGNLPVGEHLRAKIPLQNIDLQGMVNVSATLVISPEVDPEFPSTYTRSGLEVSFRPHSEKFNKYEDGKTAGQPKTRSFFSAKNLYGKPEYLFREDGHKWEPCLRNSQDFRAGSLKDSCFDIYYHHRSGGSKAENPKTIPYALIVSISAPKVKNLYAQVVRAYANILIPIKPRIRIPIQTFG